MRTLLAVALASGAALVGAASAHADTIVNVTSTTGWVAPATSGGVGSFVSGPGTAPFGTGSYKLETPASGSKVQLMTNQFANTSLSSINGIGFSTYRTSSLNGAQDASINIISNLGANATAATTPSGTPAAPGTLTISYATLVYEPYWTATNAGIFDGQWQTWNAFVGRWWTNKVGGVCGPDNPCSWSTLVAMFPNAKILNDPPEGSFGVNQGSSNENTVSSTDGLYLSTTTGGKTTFNFDPPAADTTGPSCGALVVHRGAHDTADVTITDAGSGIASITNFTVTNGTSTIPSFNPGDHSVTVSTSKGTQGQRTFFEFDVTDVAGNTTHCV